MLWTHSKNKDRPLQKVLNIKLKEYTQEKDQDQDEHGKELRCSSGMKERSIKKFACSMTHTKWRCLKKVIS
jgi:hypothetical protein